MMLLKIRRLFACYLDFLIIMVITFYPIGLINNNILKVILGLGACLIVFKYVIIKDCIIGNESIGKKIMRLKIYKDDTYVKDKELLKNRNKVSLESFPLYPIYILFDNKSPGDDKYNTIVK